MAQRIPQDFIDEVLARTDLVALVDERVGLKRAGKNWVACCPFHQEKTPSFSVNPDKQFYYCFGCGAGGNAISFVMDHDHASFPEAVKTLAWAVGLSLPESEAETDAGASRAQEQAKLHRVLTEASRFYQKQLRQAADRQRAVDYLKGRGISGQTAKAFELGYAPAGWDHLLKALGEDAEQRRALVEAGLVIEKDAHRRYDRLRDRIIFPIRDPRGRTIAFGGRVLGDGTPKYLNSPETPVFHKGRELYGLYEARQHNRRLERLLVVEGYMDVIGLAEQGLPMAVATLGTATSQDHLERLFRYVPEVVFCFDGDPAGRQAAHRAMETALPVMRDGRQVRFLFLPEGEDPDSLVQREGAGRFRERLEEALPFSEYFIRRLSEQTDTSSVDGKARLVALAGPYLTRLPDGVFGELLIQRLAEETGLAQASVRQTLSAAPDSARSTGSPEPAQPASRSQSEAPRRQQPSVTPPRGATTGRSPADAIIKLISQAPHRGAQLERPAWLDELELPGVALIGALLEFTRTHPNISTARLIGHWSNTEEGEHIARLLAEDPLPPDDESVDIQLKHAMQGLKVRHLEQQVDAALREEPKDPQTIKALNQALSEAKQEMGKH